MTQGIRDYTNARFLKYLPELAALGNAGFRAKVMGGTITKFGISVASAATHYNHSLKSQRAADPKSVSMLGRPEDKKGGRKPIHTVDVIKVKTGEVIASGISKGAAELLITTAVAKKKAKLAIKPVEAVAEVAPAVAVAAPEAVTA
jgi:hypothetical protein